MILRAQLRNGDAWQGRYLRHDARFLYLYATGRTRRIELAMIADVFEPRATDVTKSSPICLEDQ